MERRSGIAGQRCSSSHRDRGRLGRVLGRVMGLLSLRLGVGVGLGLGRRGRAPSNAWRMLRVDSSPAGCSCRTWEGAVRGNVGFLHDLETSFL
jgi:hypothetical protein